MRNIVTFFTAIMLMINSNAQTDFTTGWYFLTETSETMTLVPSIIDYDTDELHEFYYQPNEVVLLFQKSKGIYTGYDAIGRMIQVKGDVIQVKTPGRLVTITQDIAVDMDLTLTTDHAYWMVGVDSATMTRKIELANGKTVSVKQELTETLDDIIRLELTPGKTWNKVE